jgi:beta-lactamase regulating signal transducer with metallopeptidase domain
MFIQDISDFFDWDFDFSTTLCLTLAHSLWQIALLAYMAREFVRISSRKDAQWGYGVYVGTLVLALLALPATFWFLSETSLEVATLGIEISEPITKPIELTQPEALIAPAQAEAGVPLDPPSSVDAVLADSFRLSDWAPKVLLFYVVGVFTMLTRLGWAFVGTQYLARHGEPITVGPVVEAVNRLIHAWGMRVRPVVTHVHDIVVPQVVGLLRPTILLPTSALSGLTPAELEMILAHELAHVQRLDMWVNLLQRLSEAVLFFNPALWYLSRQISAYREYCCDEQTCGSGNESASSRVQYAQALLRVVELAKGAGHGRQVAALAATGNRPSELQRRVARLFGEPLREPVGLSRGGLMMVITGMVLLFAVPIGWQNAAEVPAKNADARTEIKGLPVETIERKDEARKIRKFLDAFGNDPTSSLIASSIRLPEWLQSLEQQGDIKSYFIQSKEDFFQTLETHFDAHAGYPDAFAGVIEGFERDPYGPQVDVLAMIKEDLGDRLIVATFPSNSATMGEKHLVCWDIQNRPEVEKALKRIFNSDMNAQRTSIAGVAAWKLFDTRFGTAGACVYDDHLLVASEFFLLKQILLRTKSVTSDDNPRVPPNNAGSERIAALKELVDSYEADYERVEALFKLGVEGGEHATKAQAQVRLALARADLAKAEDNPEELLKQLSIALVAAEEAVQALEVKYTVGRATLEELSAVRAERARVKMRQADARDATLRGTGPDESEDFRVSQPDQRLR